MAIAILTKRDILTISNMMRNKIEWRPWKIRVDIKCTCFCSRVCLTLHNGQVCIADKLNPSLLLVSLKALLNNGTLSQGEATRFFVQTGS